MKRIKYCLPCALAAIIICSCTKSSTEKSLTAAEMLTSKQWRLVSYGFDGNKNGSIDPNEEAIRDCERDNTYIFNKDGSGIANENSNVCNGNDPSHEFIWALKNNNTVLDFYFGTAYINRLCPDSLVISDSNSDQVRLLLVYTH
jgi:hypothetical protein